MLENGIIHLGQIMNQAGWEAEKSPPNRRSRNLLGVGESVAIT